MSADIEIIPNFVDTDRIVECAAVYARVAAEVLQGS